MKQGQTGVGKIFRGIPKFNKSKLSKSIPFFLGLDFADFMSYLTKISTKSSLLILYLYCSFHHFAIFFSFQFSMGSDIVARDILHADLDPIKVALEPLQGKLTVLTH